MGIYRVYFQRGSMRGQLAPLRGVFETLARQPTPAAGPPPLAGMAAELSSLLDAAAALLEEHVPPSARPIEYTELARAALAVGLDDHVVAFVERALDAPDPHLLSVLDDIVNVGDVGLYKRLLPILWRKPSLAYRVCVQLALTHRPQAQDIARTISLWSARPLPDGQPVPTDDG